MSPASSVLEENSRAVEDPFAQEFSFSFDIKELYHLQSLTYIPMERELLSFMEYLTGTASITIPGVFAFPSQGMEKIHKENSISKKNQAALNLIYEWLSDETGYDEQNWPVIKKAIEENRLSTRRRFSD